MFKGLSAINAIKSKATKLLEAAAEEFNEQERRRAIWKGALHWSPFELRASPV